MTDEKPYTEESSSIAMADLVAGWRAMDRRVQQLEEWRKGAEALIGVNEEPFTGDPSALYITQCEAFENTRSLRCQSGLIGGLHRWAQNHDEKVHGIDPLKGNSD